MTAPVLSSCPGWVGAVVLSHHGPHPISRCHECLAGCSYGQGSEPKAAAAFLSFAAFQLLTRVEFGCLGFSTAVDLLLAAAQALSLSDAHGWVASGHEH